MLSLLRYIERLRENNRIRMIWRSILVGPAVFLAEIPKKTPILNKFRARLWLQTHLIPVGAAAVIISLAFFNVFAGEKGNFIFRNELGGPELVEEKADLTGTAFDASANETFISSQDITGLEEPYTGEEDHYLVVGENAVAAYLNPLTVNASLNTRTGLITYTVRPGDMPSEIAATFGITTNTLLWANGLSQKSYIKPDQQLVILPVSGVKHEVKKDDTVGSIAKKYGADGETIIAYNHLTDDGNLKIGDILIIPDGKMPAAPAARKTSTVSAQYVSLPNLAGYFIFPTTGWNWGRVHPVNAVDIANDCGTPVYAAAAGIVAEALNVCSYGSGSSCNHGYGKTVLISHSNGTETRYGHFNRVSVSAGDYVDQGQLIGYMGNSGHVTGVTGCHLHFEVHGARNPLAK